MAEVLMNSSASLLSSNSFPCYRCSSHEDSRIKYSRCLKLGSLGSRRKTNSCAISGGIVCSHGGLKGRGVGLCHVSLLNGSAKLWELNNFKVMVASFEHGLVCELGEVPLIGRDQEKEEEVEEEQPFWGSSTLDRVVDFGAWISNSPSIVSKWDETRLYYLEERDEEALSIRIVALSRTNKKASALALFRSMEFAGLQPNIHACNSLLSCLSRSNMLNELRRVFAFMKQNDIMSGHSCSLVLKALASCRGSDVALQMFSEWQKESQMRQNFDVIVYNTMISICGKSNKWFQMERIWTSMKESGIFGTTVTYCVLVCTFVRCRQFEMAIDAYCEMLQSGVKPGCDAMQAIIGAYAKEEQWDSALSVFHHMLKCGLKPNLIACNALINSLGKAGKGSTPDVSLYNAAIHGMCLKGKYQSAKKLYLKMRDIGLAPDGKTRAMMLQYMQKNST